MNSDKTVTIKIEGDKLFKIFSAAYSKADVFQEALNLARIEQTALKVPALHEVTRIDGCWAICIDRIQGGTLAALMAAHPEKKGDYLKILASLQVQVNSTTEPRLDELKDHLHQKIRTCGLCATERFALHTRLREMPEAKTVYLGDFNPENVIISENGDPYIVDWDHAAHGDGAANAADTYLFFLLGKDEEAAEKYLELYCELSGTARELILRWVPIAAAARLQKSDRQTYELLLEKAKLYK